MYPFKQVFISLNYELFVHRALQWISTAVPCAAGGVQESVQAESTCEGPAFWGVVENLQSGCGHFSYAEVKSFVIKRGT